MRLEEGQTPKVGTAIGKLGWWWWRGRNESGRLRRVGHVRLRCAALRCPNSQRERGDLFCTNARHLPRFHSIRTAPAQHLFVVASSTASQRHGFSCRSIHKKKQKKIQRSNPLSRNGDPGIKKQRTAQVSHPALDLNSALFSRSKRLRWARCIGWAAFPRFLSWLLCLLRVGVRSAD